MLRALFGSESSERILIFINSREEGYASEITKFYNANLFSIQQKLDKLEAGGILVSFTAGRTRLYSFNPRYPFLIELKALLMKALDYYPEEIKESLIMNRRRPRRRGKPL
jgi:predicted transcriptional regulator